MNKKYIALLLVLVLSLGMFTGCNGKDSAEPKEPVENGDATDATEDSEDDIKLADEQVYVYSTNSPTLGLNPMLNTTGPDNGSQEMFLETLVRQSEDKDGNVVYEPGAAKEWDISEDKLTYTFYIREDAKWNDGVAVTANDFQYTFRKLADPAMAATNAWLFDGIIENFSESLYNDGETEGYDKKPEDIGVVAEDDYTLVMTLEKPFPSFLELLNGAKPVREDKYEELGDKYGSSIETTLMNGPFVLTEWDETTLMVFEKNPNYWNVDNVILDKVEQKIISEPQTVVQALIAGEIDVAGAREPEHRALIEAEGDRFIKMITAGDGPEFLGLNCSNKYFKNEKIRQAFSIAYDREKYIEQVNSGLGEPMYTMIPHVINAGEDLYVDIVGGRNHIVKKLQEENPDPKALLIEGLKEEGLDPDPAKMEVKYSTRGTSDYSKKSAEWLLQEYREKLGVDIIIDMIEWNIMWKNVESGEYDICTAGWGPYYNDPMALLTLYDPKDGYFNSSKSGWSGPDADKYKTLLEEASNITDDKERAEVLLQAEEILIGSAVIIPTYTAETVTYVAPYVGGLSVSPHTGTDYTKVYIMEK